MKDNVQQTHFNNPAKSSPDVKVIKAKKKPQRKKEKKQKRMKGYGRLFGILHALVSLYFLVMLYMLDILPFLEHLMITAVVVVLFFVTVVSQKGKRFSRVLGRLYSTLVMVLLLCGGTVLGVGNYVLRSVTDAPFEQKKQEMNLMDMNFSTSITEDVFCIYLRDAGEDATKDSASTQNVLLSVNPETRQLLRVIIPNEYHISIPGVSEGQRELIQNAGLYGPEAAPAALENLYETDISYYLKLDYEWMDEVKKIWEAPSVDSLKKFAKDVLHVEQRIQTNLSAYEVRQLIKKEITSESNWWQEGRNATGSMTESYTYSSPDEMIPVMTPDQASIDEVVDLIRRIQEGEVFEKPPVQEPPAIVIP